MLKPSYSTSVRLQELHRAALERAAKDTGKGVSTLILYAIEHTYCTTDEQQADGLTAGKEELTAG